VEITCRKKREPGSSAMKTSIALLLLAVSSVLLALPAVKEVNDSFFEQERAAEDVDDSLLEHDRTAEDDETLEDAFPEQPEQEKTAEDSNGSFLEYKRVGREKRQISTHFDPLCRNLTAI